MPLSSSPEPGPVPGTPESKPLSPGALEPQPTAERDKASAPTPVMETIKPIDFMKAPSSREPGRFITPRAGVEEVRRASETGIGLCRDGLRRERNGLETRVRAAGGS